MCGELRAQLRKEWKKLQAIKGSDEQDAYAMNWTYPQKGGADVARTTRYFTTTEELFIKTACDISSSGGFPLRRLTVMEVRAGARRTVLSRSEARGRGGRASHALRRPRGGPPSRHACPCD